MSDFKKRVFDKYNGRCAYCGHEITIDNMTVDHKIPKSKGGSLALANCLPSCRRCNELKADGTVEAMREKLLQLRKTISKNREFQMLRKYGLVKFDEFGDELAFHFEIKHEDPYTIGG